MKNYLTLMSRKTKIKCFGIILLALICAVLTSIWPVLLGELYTAISNGSIKTIEQGLGDLVLFAFVYLLAECITIVRRVAIDCTIASHESEVRDYSIEKLLKMPVSYYSGCLSGEKTAQMNQGVAGFSQLIKLVCNDVFSTILVAICTLVQVFIHAPLVIVGAMFLYLMISLIVSVFQIRSQNGIRERIVSQKNALDGQVCQSISNLELIRGMSAEDFERKRLLPSILNISRTEKKHHRYMGSFDCLKQLCKVLFQVLILGMSIVLISKGDMSAGSAITVCLLFQQIIKPIDEVYRFMDETASSVIKSKALLDVTSRPVDEVFSISSSTDETDGTDIQIEDVIVTNPERSIPIAKYERIVIPGERIVALKGPNGCGKSSLIRCLMRYYPHTQGTISIFGTDQERIDQKQLTNMLYYTPQVSRFIAGTVRENLLYGLERDVSDDELIHALQNVHLFGTGHNDSVISIDPQAALNQMLGEKADELSGGMKQRLSLARAFLRKPRLFIFDEITANLDKDATDYVLKNIELYAKDIGAGIVYISHDQKVIDRCNSIIELSNKLNLHDTGDMSAA